MSNKRFGTVANIVPNIAVFQWLQHFWNHENMFETGVVRAN